MIGMSRSVRDGKTVAFEFIRIVEQKDGGLEFIASPSGQNTTSFSMVSLGDRAAGFEQQPRLAAIRSAVVEPEGKPDHLRPPGLDSPGQSAPQKTAERRGIAEKPAGQAVVDIGGESDAARVCRDRNAGNGLAQQRLQIDLIAGGRHPNLLSWRRPADWMAERAARWARIDQQDSHSPFVREV